LHGGDGLVMGFEGGVHLTDGGAQQGGVRRERVVLTEADEAGDQRLDEGGIFRIGGSKVVQGFSPHRLGMDEKVA